MKLFIAIIALALFGFIAAAHASQKETSATDICQLQVQLAHQLYKFPIKGKVLSVDDLSCIAGKDIKHATLKYSYSLIRPVSVNMDWVAFDKTAKASICQNRPLGLMMLAGVGVIAEFKYANKVLHTTPAFRIEDCVGSSK